jgi:peptide-methionine (S)-S-oxide reductase
MLSFLRKSAAMPASGQALPGRPDPIPTAAQSRVGAHHALQGPYPDGIEVAYFGMGCFWGAERLFWRLGRGIHVTAVGYQGGETPNPTYEEVCSGGTGHTEVVLVAYDPREVSYDALLKAFWENHDPTQGMRQGNDVGTQYRSAIYTTTPAQADAAERSKAAYTEALAARGLGPVTTEIREAPPFFFAEDYHQQYLDRVPHGYCNLAGTGVGCPIGLGVAAE